MPRSRFIEQNFPHIVETALPMLGGKWDAMNDFHARHGIKAHLRRCRDKDGRNEYIRWHFADREIAEAFAAKFAKERTTVPL
jgi:hypothetical protein